MADESLLHDQVERGDRAKIALTAWQEAYDATKADLRSAFENSKHDEHERRERIYDSLCALTHMYEYLRRRVLTGDTAGKELIVMKDPSRIKRMMGVGRKRS